MHFAFINTIHSLKHFSGPGYLPETPRHCVQDPCAPPNPQGNATFTSWCRTGEVKLSFFLVKIKFKKYLWQLRKFSCTFKLKNTMFWVKKYGYFYIVILRFELHHFEERQLKIGPVWANFVFTTGPETRHHASAAGTIRSNLTCKSKLAVRYKINRLYINTTAG